MDLMTDNDTQNYSDEISELKKQIEEHPENYEIHIRYINSLRNAKDYDQTRKARELTSSRFPLPPGLWLQWIKDEKEIAKDEESCLKILDLFNRATQDYLDPSLSLKMIHFIEFLWKKDYLTKNKVIDFIFSTLNQIECFHVEKTLKVFNISISLLTQINTKQMKNKNKKKKQKNENDHDIDNLINQIYKKAFSLPIKNDNNQLIRSYKLLHGVNDDSPIILEAAEIQKKAGIQRENIEMFELLIQQNTPVDSIENPGVVSPKLVSSFKQYIDYEIRESSKITNESTLATTITRIKGLFERCITLCFLSSEIWDSYISWLKSLKPPNYKKEDICKVYYRSTRNCPWVSHNWVGYARILEEIDFEKNEKEKINSKLIKDLFNRAFLAEFPHTTEYIDVGLTVMDFYRRLLLEYGNNVDNTEIIQEFYIILQKISRRICFITFTGNESKTQLTNKSNSIFNFYHYWADIEIRLLKNTSNARRCYDDAVKSGHYDIRLWEAWINMETCYGLKTNVIDVYKKSITATVSISHDWRLQHLCEKYIQYTRERGTLEEYNTAVIFCQPFLTLKAINLQENIKRRSDIQPISGSGSYQHQQKTHKTDNQEIDKKRKEKDFVKNDKSYKKEKIQKIQNKTKVEKKKPEPLLPTIPTPEEVERRNAASDKTVFVLNLAWTTTDDQLKEAFKPAGTVVDVRHVHDHTGKSKGFAYVEFNTSDECNKAIDTLNNITIAGRSVKVEKCQKRQAIQNEARKQKDKISASSLVPRSVQRSKKIIL